MSRDADQTRPDHLARREGRRCAQVSRAAASRASMSAVKGGAATCCRANVLRLVEAAERRKAIFEARLARKYARAALRSIQAGRR